MFRAACTTKFGLILKKISKNDKYLITSEWQARGGAWQRAPEEVLKDAPPEAGAGGENTQKK